MTATVELNVRSKLSQIADDLKAIADAGHKAEQGFSRFGRDVGEVHERATKRTESFLARLRGIGGRVFDGMKEDFKALLATIGVSEGLRLGQTFRDNVRETFELSDTIRKLGAVFGLAEDQFASFQVRLTRGLGDIGLGADAAMNALKGLAETQVRGEENLTAYALSAGQLASATGSKNKEGDIAQGVARVITAQGQDPNDVGRMREVMNDLRKAYNATGQIPTAILQALETVVANMPTDFRKAISTQGLVELGAISATAGPGATKFLEEYLGKSPVARSALDARGFKGVVGPDGFDAGKFREAAGGVMSAFPGDPRLMAQTLGLSEEAAEGFVRLYESLDRVIMAQTKMSLDNKSLASQYRDSMGAAEAFRASLNKVKSSLAEPLTWMTDSITRSLRGAFEFSLSDLIKFLPDGSLKTKLQSASESGAVPEALGKNLGATATVAGAGLLTATLAGGGLRGLLSLGKGKATGVAERLAYEQATGASVQDVYVVNAAEIGQAAGGGAPTEMLTGAAKLAGIAGLLAKTAMVGAAGVGGYAVGNLLNESIEGTEFSAALDRILAPLFSAVSGRSLEAPGMSQPIGPEAPPEIVQRTRDATKNQALQNRAMHERTSQIGPQSPTARPAAPQRVDVRVQVDVDTKNKDLKATPRPGRGGAQ